MPYKHKILIIDDDVNLLTSLKRLLLIDDYDVNTADNATKGLAMLPKVKPDLIILDLAMPGMSGLGFLREISGADGKPSYPVLVLTARANMEGFFSDLDVDGFIEKPCSSETLENEIERILNIQSEKPKAEIKPKKAEANIKKRILLADDDEEILKRLEEDLTNAGYDVTTVTNGADVIENVILSKPAGVIVKHVLKGMNGDKIASMLSEMPHTHDIPVILYAEDETPETAARFAHKTPNIYRYLATCESHIVVSAINTALPGR